MKFCARCRCGSASKSRRRCTRPTGAVASSLRRSTIASSASFRCKSTSTSRGRFIASRTCRQRDAESGRLCLSKPVVAGPLRRTFRASEDIAETSPSKEYTETREFYRARGYTPLEDFTTLWSPRNPALSWTKCCLHSAAVLEAASIRRHRCAAGRELDLVGWSADHFGVILTQRTLRAHQVRKRTCLPARRHPFCGPPHERLLLEGGQRLLHVAGVRDHLRLGLDGDQRGAIERHRLGLERRIRRPRLDHDAQHGRLEGREAVDDSQRFVVACLDLLAHERSKLLRVPALLDNRSNASASTAAAMLQGGTPIDEPRIDLVDLELVGERQLRREPCDEVFSQRRNGDQGAPKKAWSLLLRSIASLS